MIFVQNIALILKILILIRIGISFCHLGIGSSVDFHEFCMINDILCLDFGNKNKQIGHFGKSGIRSNVFSRNW